MGQACLESPIATDAESPTITYTQIRDLLDGLGLGRDLSDVKSIHIDSAGVAVVRYLLNENGQRHVAGSGIATVTTKIRLVGP